jgi:hypothetical protein
MSKSEKLKFDRESKLVVNYVCVAKSMINDGYDERTIGTVEYLHSGEVIMKCEGFEHKIANVDEVEVVVSPMDSLFSKVTFKIKKMDDSTTTLPHKFYGIRGTNVLINYENEISGADTLPEETE